MRAAAVPDLRVARAHWLARDLIAWPSDMLPDGMDPAALDWRLHWSPEDGINPREPEPVPWSTATLRYDPEGLPARVTAEHPHLSRCLAVRLSAGHGAQAEEILRGQVAVSVHKQSGRLVAASAVQIPWVLDDLYPGARDATLGITWSEGRPALGLWAPTARQVRLALWPAGVPLHDQPLFTDCVRDADGVWRVTGDSSWDNGRYRYEVTVFAPFTQRVVTHQVTDPYSIALTINSTHSVIVNLDDADLRPREWLDTRPPRLDGPVDQVIYELHVRDFSIHDKSVPEDIRGSYRAFTVPSQGMAHLKRLADAGLNTVQLLPVFDNATVEEHRGWQERPEKASLRALPPDSAEQQAHIGRSSRLNGFNWGYDPLHYQASEGSYSSSLEMAEGRHRVSEFRSMVGALHAIGLRVVLDQVFNHTASSGQDTKSVLDRIVPGYYHRLSPTGTIETSTCCPNVATEHAMAEKLMVDSVLTWVRHYRVDGFRFDLMGFHSRDNMLAVRRALDALTEADDGVDGSAVTMYGEGWSFGEVADNAQFHQARQGQLSGTAIATFSDRLRDAVRGGSPFDADPRVQGFGSGLMTADNGTDANGNGFEQRDRLLYYTDLVQLGLAGNLRSFTFCSSLRGVDLRGDELEFQGQAAAYAEEPDEVLTYVDAHDNETLFDALTLKLHLGTTMPERVRMNALCLALATYAQSPVMWHAGSDILRSKNLDRNSYNSGDWFNYIDFSMTYNGFGGGLPPEIDNRDKWRYLKPLLGNPALRPESGDIRAAHELALDVLRVRASSRLFRLGSAALVHRKLSFPVSGTWQQIPGVIVMRINDQLGEPVDPRWAQFVVVFNATPRPVRQAVPGIVEGFRLSPVQASGFDDVVRREASVTDEGFSVPARTAAVFVLPR